MSVAPAPTMSAWCALEGASAVVTGGAGGIGLAIARRLDTMGVTVSLMGRNLPNLKRALRELDRGRPHDAIACDVGDGDAVAVAFETLARQGRSPQILVNNAGTATSATFADLSERLWNDTLRVNLTGTYLCTRAALPGLMALPFGRIVNIASTAGLIGYSHVAAYCAAKHGVIGLTRALATELARTRITVNAVCPGYTDTGMVDEAIAAVVRGTGRSESDARETLLRRNPQRRLVLPDEVAATVAWLCLPESQSINGQAISLSGGEVMTG